MGVQQMREFEMSHEQMDTLISSMKASPALIMIQCGKTASQQERANKAWELLGLEMGFKYMTVVPSNKGSMFFTAEETN
jgi:hypothetical protein